MQEITADVSIQRYALNAHRIRIYIEPFPKFFVIKAKKVNIPFRSIIHMRKLNEKMNLLPLHFIEVGAKTFKLN